jgi:hypothetical protein
MKPQGPFTLEPALSVNSPAFISPTAEGNLQ